MKPISAAEKDTFFQTIDILNDLSRNELDEEAACLANDMQVFLGGCGIAIPDAPRANLDFSTGDRIYSNCDLDHIGIKKGDAFIADNVGPYWFELIGLDGNRYSDMKFPMHCFTTESPEEAESARLIDIALGRGWEFIRDKLHLPGDISDSWCTEWLQRKYKGNTVYIPHYLERRMAEIADAEEINRKSTQMKAGMGTAATAVSVEFSAGFDEELENVHSRLSRLRADINKNADQILQRIEFLEDASTRQNDVLNLLLKQIDEMDREKHTPETEEEITYDWLISIGFKSNIAASVVNGVVTDNPESDWLSLGHLSIRKRDTIPVSYRVTNDTPFILQTKRDVLDMLRLMRLKVSRICDTF